MMNDTAVLSSFDKYTTFSYGGRKLSYCMFMVDSMSCGKEKSPYEILVAIAAFTIRI